MSAIQWESREVEVGAGDQEHRQQRGHGHPRPLADNPQVVAPVGRQQQNGADEDHPLTVGIAVKGGGAADDGRCRPARRDLAVEKVGQHKGGVEPDHHGGLKGGARVQEPRRERRHDQPAGPPQPELVKPLEREHEGCRTQQPHHYRGRPHHGDALSKQDDPGHVEPHREAEVEDIDVSEVRGQEVPLGIAEAVVHQIAGEVGVNCLVAEEEDREVLDGDQPGGCIKQQHHGQKHQVAAGEPERGPLGGRRPG